MNYILKLGECRVGLTAPCSLWRIREKLNIPKNVEHRDDVLELELGRSEKLPKTYVRTNRRANNERLVLLVVK